MRKNCAQCLEPGVLIGDTSMEDVINRVGVELQNWSRYVLGDLKNRMKKVK